MNRHLFFILVIVTVLISSCTDGTKLFTNVSSETTGITFNNIIPDNDSLSILRFDYIYNGGGVAIADYNNDGLQDILFTGNIVDNALYLNRGDWNYEDVSVVSGISPSGRWSTGVAVIDINLDGLQDLYITASGHDKTEVLSNQLLICQHIDSSGIPHYKDMSSAYGLVDSSYSTNAAFFDYDNDEDLDLIVINNRMVEDRNASRYRDRTHDIQTLRTDLLFENNWNEELGHPVFSDISEQAGLLEEGFSLGLNVHDFNKDGWSDVLITNDFLTTDILYINQQDGTFKDEAATYFKHTSFSAMGMDVVDFDNDGLSEVVAVDMLPADNFRRKTMLPPNSYTSYLNNEKFNYQYQHVRNTLQKNNFNKDQLGKGAVFHEQSLVSGIAATDWSWTPMAADFDNDGDKDLIITNGFPKDITDRDFIDYNTEVGIYASDATLLPKAPSVKLPNVAYENMGELRFENKSVDWGIMEPSFSNGAAYADLDNDGDLDFVTNNINDVASLYQNNSTNNAIRIQLVGPAKNPGCIGAEISIYSQGELQQINYIRSRGYLSSIEPYAHFGIGNNTSIDSLIVKWPDGAYSKELNIATDDVHQVSYNSSLRMNRSSVDASHKTHLLENVNNKVNLNYIDKETDYNDFNVQPMLLHKLSQYGPGVAVGDVNNDGLEDMYISGSHFENGIFQLQQSDGTYQEAQLIVDTLGDKPGEELSTLLIDIDGDDDLDLYTVLGGYEYDMDEDEYSDRLYENRNGSFHLLQNALPAKAVSGSVASAADYDNDGDLDLFVGGRVLPGDYPTPVSSYILTNNSTLGNISFVDNSSEVAPMLDEIGMITDALWSDYDNDGDKDLILTGEFMPITILNNSNGKFKDLTSASGLDKHIGWWNSITAGDFDKDGDIDYIAGNYGEQTQTLISSEHPISVYYYDYDNNGSRDLIPTCWFPNKEGQKAEYPYFSRLEYQKQLTKVQAQFDGHAAYAQAPITEILSQKDIDSSIVLRAHYMLSSYIQNNGDGTFTISALPSEVQLAPVYGSMANDINNDGHLDVLMIGNDYGIEVATGRLDAHDGLVLLGDGKGGFEFQHANQSNFYVQADGKSLTSLYNQHSGQLDIMAFQNQGPLRVFNKVKKGAFFKFDASDAHAIVSYKDGSSTKLENSIGSSYLAQASSYQEVGGDIREIRITNNKGQERLATILQ